LDRRHPGENRVILKDHGNVMFGPVPEYAVGKRRNGTVAVAVGDLLFACRGQRFQHQFAVDVDCTVSGRLQPGEDFQKR
jgi:hypothetical protein